MFEMFTVCFHASIESLSEVRAQQTCNLSLQVNCPKSLLAPCSFTFRSDTFLVSGSIFAISQALRPIRGNPAGNFAIIALYPQIVYRNVWIRILSSYDILPILTNNNWIILIKQFITWKRRYSVIYDVINNVTVLLLLDF